MDTGELINITKLLAILRIAADGEAATWPDLAEQVGLSRTALWRLLKRAEAGMGVCVEATDEGPRVTAWGVLDRRTVVGPGRMPYGDRLPVEAISRMVAQVAHLERGWSSRNAAQPKSARRAKR